MVAFFLLYATAHVLRLQAVAFWYLVDAPLFGARNGCGTAIQKVYIISNTNGFFSFFFPLPANDKAGHTYSTLSFPD